MPRYFPNLRSIKELAETMSRNKGREKYRGLIPETEVELPEARKQLAQYMRKIWDDELFALEIELAVDESNYEERIGDYIKAELEGG